MGGPGTNMNMNGADASAAAGLNSTKDELALHRPGACPPQRPSSFWPTAGTVRRPVHMAPIGLRARADVLRPDQRRPVRPGDEPGRRAATPTRRRRRPPATSRVADELPGRLLRQPDHRGGRTKPPSAPSIPPRSTGSSMPRRPRASRSSSLRCTCFPTHSTKTRRCPTARSSSGTSAPTSASRRPASPATPLTITGLRPVPGGFHHRADALHDAWCGRCRSPAVPWPSSRRTSRSSRRRRCRPARESRGPCHIARSRCDS